MAWSKFDSMYLFIINYGNRSENKVNSVYACLFNLSRTVCVRCSVCALGEDPCHNLGAVCLQQSL